MKDVVQAYLFGFNEFELHATSGPRDEVGIARVVQQGHQELPELQRAAALVRRALAKNATPFLLHLTWKKEETDRRSAVRPTSRLQAFLCLENETRSCRI